MKRWMAAVMALCMLGMTACAPDKTDETMQSRVIKELEAIGVQLQEEVIQEADETMQQMQLTYAEFAQSGVPMEMLTGQTSTEEDYAYALLMLAGMGRYDENTWEWTPLSDDVYTLEWEVWDMGGAYTQYLQGIEAIVDGIIFTQVEDSMAETAYDWTENIYSGSTEAGERRITFLCNGHPYAVKLDGSSAWFDERFITYVEGVLYAEGVEGQLYYIGREMDMVYLVVYGDRKKAQKLAKLSGCEVME